ncbi:MAG: transposase, partial [Myxococcota bacterium]
MRNGINDMHPLQELVRLHRMGRSAAHVAKTLNMDRKTERKYRKRIAAAGLLAGDAADLPTMDVLKAATAARRTRPPRQEVSTVAAYSKTIDDFRLAGVGPTAIHGLLVEKHGQDVGSVSAVKRLFARLKQASGPSPGDVAIPVHTAPGQQAQVDFGYVGELRDPQSGVLKKAWVFVMTLSYSRALFARIVFHQDLATWLSLHRAAFQWFGGVPREVVPDNLKAAVIHAAFKADEMGALNRSYRDLGRSYRFLIDPTPAYSPQKKGKVESAVKYVKTFLTPRVANFSDIDQANERLETWVRQTANRRTHGTTGRVPQDVLDATERVGLLPLPAHPIVPAEWRELSVGRNSHVTVDKRFYSVPWTHIGSRAWVRIRGEALTVFIDSERVADHRTTGDTPWSTMPAHLPEGRRDLADRDPENWFRRAQALGSEVEDYARFVMASDDVHYPLRRVQSIVMKLEKL